MARHKNRTPKAGRWDHAVSPLQQARHDHRWPQHHACQVIQQVCPGHSGKPCRLDASKLSEWEHGKKPPSLIHVQAMCRAYQRSAEDLGLITWRDKPSDQAPRAGHDLPTEETPTNTAYDGLDPEPHPEVADAMRRSTFVKGAAGAAGAFLADPIVAITRRVQESLATTKVSNRELESLSQAAWRHALDYYDIDGPGRAEALTTDWATAAQLMQTTKTQTQARELGDAFARLSATLGAYVYDHGDNRRATHLFRTGEEAAREAGNNDLAAWLCERQSLVYSYNSHDDARGENPRKMIDVVQRGLEISGTARTRVTARLHARAAQGYAMLGFRQPAEASLAAAEDALSAAVPGCWPSDDSVPHGCTYTPELLEGARGCAYRLLGEYERAKAAAERELAIQLRYTGPRAKSTTLPLSQLSIADCHVHLKEPVEACYLATAAVGGYAGVGETVVLRRARRFQADLVAAYPELKVTREFTEFLRSRRPEPPGDV